ncbi:MULTISPECIES: site-specific integrase [Cupriavidus]|uniref:Site-specific integrase n=1 Tax=Cupriavidus basilensis TaxID=68895 RepID=A0A643G2C6_9BURK|nr:MULTISPECIES: site-specific integrase [Cupriavidus]KUE87943.1 integrase [Cupriavidus necator]NOV23708.1 site-specific integrase [Cupriavidus necator]QOT81765.1 site-specific integrase [Cupriavidus basilensis]BDB30386.1 site-specific integrase [Cupriavidus sp. P-10]
MIARRTTIRQLPLTEVVDRDTPGATPVSITTPEGGTVYHTVPLADPATGKRRDARPQWIPSTFPLFPVVRLADGAPWAEANIWLIDMLESKSSPNMLTFASIADDLVAFRRYLDDEDIDWLTFPANKRQRPTYRYSASIRLAVQAGELSAGVAKRRMGAIARFYRWLITEAGFRPANAPWVESDRFIEVKDQKGFSGVIEVKTTDLSIRCRRAEDPWDDRIQDGGRLRPLSSSEQSVLLESLAALGNIEMTLVHLFALLTGARIQTVLTVRAKHVMRKPGEFHGDDIRLACGPGTGIDTKGGVKGVLHLPRGFYERLYIYVHSDRARKRRQLADGGDDHDQPLFLSHRGAPLYDDLASRGPVSTGPKVRRHVKTGQAVRQFIKDELLPMMRERLGNLRYEFSFHDLRATFGLNMVDAMTANETRYTRALDQLRQLMWHARLSTTEGYLSYRENRKLFDAVQDSWGTHLSTLVTRALDTGVAV